MGYILPLTHYQYEEYQKRIINKQDRFHIDKLFKVMPVPEHKEKDQHMMQKKTDKTLVGNAQEEKVYAKITGKGTWINKSV